MTVRIGVEGGVNLVGECSSGDAETLRQYLSVAPGRVVTWSDCTGAHTAVIQVLLAACAVPEGIPSNPFLADVVASLFKRR